MKNIIEKILGIIFLLWFIMSFILLIYFSSIDKVYYTLYVFGQYFLVFGFIILSNKQWQGIIFSLVGLGVITINFLCHYPDRFKIDWITFGLNMSIIVLILVGSLFIVVPYIISKHKKKVCTHLVSAVILDLKVSYSGHSMVYAPIYQYNFNGNLITHESDFYSNVGVKNKGDIVNLYINPNNPHEIDTRNYTLNIVCFIMGIIIFGMGIYVLYLSING